MNANAENRGQDDRPGVAERSPADQARGYALLLSLIFAEDGDVTLGDLHDAEHALKMIQRAIERIRRGEPPRLLNLRLQE